MTAKRRSNHEGTIFKRSDGRWAVAVTLPNGKRWTKYAKTQTECRSLLRTMLRQIDDGFTGQGARSTVGAYLLHWLNIVQPNLRPKSYAQYQQLVTQYIIPELGQRRLQDLRPDHVQALYSASLKAGSSPYTLRLIHIVLHRALVQAVRWGLVSRNVADAVEKPKVPRSEMRVLDLQQVHRLLHVAESHRLSALFHLAITTGLRQGELLALRWTDLDWDTGRLQVQRQLQRISGRGLVLSEPKTAAGRRSLTLARVDLAILREHRKLQLQERLFAGPHWQENGLIFTSTRGAFVEPGTTLAILKKLLAQAGLPPIRFHDLRHTSATLMLQQGVHPKVVQEKLGHTSVNLTLNTYSHVLPSMQEQAADAIDRLFDTGLMSN